MKLKIKKNHPAAELPRYATAGAACLDITTVEAGTVYSFSSRSFRTGLAVEVPEGHVLLLFSRSGHAFNHETRLSNAVGVIDSDYRGEILVKLRTDGHKDFQVKAGERIAQGMVLPIPRCDLELVEALSSTERGAGGFGSTGAA